VGDKKGQEGEGEKDWGGGVSFSEGKTISRQKKLIGESLVRGRKGNRKESKKKKPEEEGT